MAAATSRARTRRLPSSVVLRKSRCGFVQRSRGTHGREERFSSGAAATCWWWPGEIAGGRDGQRTRTRVRSGSATLFSTILLPILLPRLKTVPFLAVFLGLWPRWKCGAGKPVAGSTPVPSAARHLHTRCARRNAASHTQSAVLFPLSHNPSIPAPVGPTITPPTRAVRTAGSERCQPAKYSDMPAISYGRPASWRVW